MQQVVSQHPWGKWTVTPQQVKVQQGLWVWVWLMGVVLMVRVAGATGFMRADGGDP